MKRQLSVASWAVISFGSSLALAQQPAGTAAPTTPPPATTPAAPEAKAAGTDPAVMGATPAPSGTPAEAPKKEGEETRFRWGISGFGGPLAGGLSGGAGGIDTRFGAQITDMFGVYGQPMLLLGAGLSSSVSGTNANASASGIALYGIGAIGDVTLSDLFYVGAGPELLMGEMASTSQSVGTAGVSAKASASTGPFLSVAARAGLAFGSMKPHRRKAFTIGLDFRMVLNPGDPVLIPCLALGYDAF